MFTNYCTTSANAPATKGAKIRCDGEVKIRGVQQPCGQVLAEVSNPNQKGGRHEVVCRRCRKRHTI